MYRALLLLFPVVAIASNIADTNADKKVAAMDSVTFCFKLGPAIRLPIGKDEAYRAAMLRRAEQSEKITGAMVGAINVKDPVLGMNLCAVMAAFGRPTRSNRSVTRYGENWQLVYEHPRRYLYIENDKLTSFQD